MVATGFGLLPPEVNSGLMYVGAGAGPMLAAASAWDGMGAELHSMAAAYGSVIADLGSEGWLGPASTAMAAAAAPYASWMSATAVRVEQTAAQLRAAVGAYEAAHAAIVPPAVVAANRAQLAMLVATNILGQNTPAIAANWAQYYEMWAQDATVMHGYAGASATASTLADFSQPPQTTNPTGAANQAAAVGQAGTGAAATHAGTVASALSAAPATASAQAGGDALENLGSVVGVTNLKDALGYGVMVPQNGSYIFSLANSLQSLAKAFGGSAGAAAATTGADALTPVLTSAVSTGSTGLSGLGGAGSAITAGLGQSGTIGGLSVPQAWAAASPVTGPIGSPLGAAGLGATPAFGGNAGAGGLMNGMPMLAHAARAAGASQGGVMPRFDLRPSVIPNSPLVG